MLEAFEAIEHLGEIARLFLVLAHKGQSRIEENALIEGCKRTACLSTRYPRPKPAIILAMFAGLLTSAGGVICITERGRMFASKSAAATLDLSHEQGKLLLGAFLDDPAVERVLSTLLGSFQLVRGQLVARKNSLAPVTTQFLFCRLLQQVGAITASGDYFVITRSFDDLLGHLVIRTAKLTQEELLHQLDRQRQRGELAEKKVFEIEKNRLVALKRLDLAAKVERISLHDVSAGYDIRSYEKNTKPRFIEVKSSVGSQVLFEWSANERGKAAKEGDAYFVYFVPFSFSLPDLSSPVVIIKNPVSFIKSGALHETSSSYTVRETPSSSGRRLIYARASTMAALIHETHTFR